MELKYILHLFFMAAATGLAMAPVGLTFESFDIDIQERACGPAKIRAMGGFAIIAAILAAIGFILAIVSLFKPLKVVNMVFAILTVVCSIIPWAIAADLWETKNQVEISGSTVTISDCGLKNFGMPFLPLFVSCTVAAIIAFVVLLVIADADAPVDAAAAEGDNNKQDDKAADAGNVDDKKEETPQPSGDDEEAKRKEQAAADQKKKDDEAAAAAAEQKKKDEEASRQEAEEKRRQAENDAAAAEQKRKDDEAAAAAADQKKKDDEAAAAAAEQKRKDDEAAAAAAEQKRKDEEAEAQRKRDEEAAEQKRKEEEAAAAKNNKPAINWKEINAKLPYDKKNMEQKKRRFEMFDMIDTNKTGKVSLSEVTAGMESVLGLGDEIDVPVVIKTAFDKAKVAGQQAGVNDDASGGDFIEKNEFRLFLMYTRMYFEMFQLFSELDETGDMRIELGEFEKSIPLLKTWGAKIDDAAETFKQIDKNGGGKVLFGEFVDWALSPEQNLDCPDEDE